MKTLLFVCCTSAIWICACTKSNNLPTQTASAASQDFSIQSKKAADMLTAHPWIYHGFYSHYIDDQHKGQRFYDRDSTGNLDEYLADVVYTFKKNHTFTRYVSPYTYHGIWSFTKAQTFLTLKFSYGTETDSIVRFDNSHLNYTKKDNYGKWFTELIPAH